MKVYVRVSPHTVSVVFTKQAHKKDKDLTSKPTLNLAISGSEKQCIRVTWILHSAPTYKCLRTRYKEGEIIEESVNDPRLQSGFTLCFFFIPSSDGVMSRKEGGTYCDQVWNVRQLKTPTRFTETTRNAWNKENHKWAIRNCSMWNKANSKVYRRSSHYHIVSWTTFISSIQ